jgi:hypothetical protein
MSLHTPIRDPLSVPPISIRAIEPTDLSDVWQSSDPAAFYRRLHEAYPHDSEIAAELARAERRGM